MVAGRAAHSAASEGGEMGLYRQSRFKHPDSEERMAHWRSHIASFAVLFAGAACLMTAPAASAQARDAEPATRQAHAEVLRSLPFADRADFDDAQRGFIASWPDGLVLATANGSSGRCNPMPSSRRPRRPL